MHQPFLKVKHSSTGIILPNAVVNMTHGTVTHIPKVKESVGNKEITVPPLRNRVDSLLTSFKAFGYCILQIAYSSAVMRNRMEKHTGFGWLSTKCQMCSVYSHTVVVISVSGYLWHILRHGLTQRSCITQDLATCEPHITPSCAGLWPPLLLNCGENKGSRKFNVVSALCAVMVACCWMLSSYLLLMPQYPEGAMSRQGQCRIWKKRWRVPRTCGERQI